jgi:hypothetical protein
MDSILIAACALANQLLINNQYQRLFEETGCWISCIFVMRNEKLERQLIAIVFKVSFCYEVIA